MIRAALVIVYLIILAGLIYLLYKHPPKKKEAKKPTSKKITIDEKQGDPNDSNIQGLTDHLMDTVLFNPTMGDDQAERLRKALEKSLLVYVKMNGK